MDRGPDFVESVNKGFRSLPLHIFAYDYGCIPTGRTINHVQDGVLLIENKVSFDLYIKFLSYLHRGYALWEWSSPLSAAGACIDNTVHLIGYFRGQSCML
jgi:hypothetical protein